MRPTPERPQTSIPKVLKILAGLYKETGGQRPLGTGRWAVQVRSVIVLGSVTLASGQSLLLEGVVSVPITGCFALQAFCLS